MEKKHRNDSVGLRITAFFLILVLLLMITSQAFFRLALYSSDNKIMKRNSVEMLLMAQKKDSIDVLVLGDSESYTTVSPMQLYSEGGITSFVAGQPGQNMAETLHMLNVALQTQKPKVVMLETDALYRDGGSGSGFKDIFNVRLSEVFPVFQYHNLWKQIGRKNSAVIQSWNGYHINYNVDGCITTKNYMRQTDKVKQVSWVTQKALGEIQQKCKDIGAKLILYSAPSPKNYNMEKHNGLQELADVKNITYIDLNLKADKLGIDWSTDTRDQGDHLNDAGAYKTTEYFLSVLQDMGLTDHRGDPAYAKWDTRSAKFMSIIEGNIAQIQSDGQGQANASSK